VDVITDAKFQANQFRSFGAPGAENDPPPLTGHIVLTTVYAITCYTVILLWDTGYTITSWAGYSGLSIVPTVQRFCTELAVNAIMLHYHNYNVLQWLLSFTNSTCNMSLSSASQGKNEAEPFRILQWCSVQSFQFNSLTRMA